MEEKRSWRIFDRLLAIGGFIFTGIAAWLAYLMYEDQHPSTGTTTTMMPPWWSVAALLVVGVAMLVTAWFRKPSDTDLLSVSGRLEAADLTRNVSGPLVRGLNDLPHRLSELYGSGLSLLAETQANVTANEDFGGRLGGWLTEVTTVLNARCERIELLSWQNPVFHAVANDPRATGIASLTAKLEVLRGIRDSHATRP